MPSSSELHWALLSSAELQWVSQRAAKNRLALLKATELHRYQQNSLSSALLQQAALSSFELNWAPSTLSFWDPLSSTELRGSPSNFTQLLSSDEFRRVELQLAPPSTIRGHLAHMTFAVNCRATTSTSKLQKISSCPIEFFRIPMTFTELCRLSQSVAKVHRPMLSSDERLQAPIKYTKLHRSHSSIAVLLESCTSSAKFHWTSQRFSEHPGAQPNSTELHWDQLSFSKICQAPPKSNGSSF